MFTPETIFSVSNSAALLGWIILIFLPRRFVPVVWIPHFVIPTLLGLAYALLILPNFASAEGDFSSIEGIRSLFMNDHLLVAGWLHYLAFDLFVGCWIALEADKIGVPRIVQAPIFVATFMFGPIGLVIFMMVRLASGWNVTRDGGARS